MTVLDSSVIVDYLDGVDGVVEFVDEQTVLQTSSICVYEVLAGEVFSSGEPDLAGTRADFGRVTAIDVSEDLALEAVRLQNRLLENGEPMSPRDLLVAATARSTEDELVVSDVDVDTDGLHELVAVTRL